MKWLKQTGSENREQEIEHETFSGCRIPGDENKPKEYAL